MENESPGGGREWEWGGIGVWWGSEGGWEWDGGAVR